MKIIMPLSEVRYIANLAFVTARTMWLDHIPVNQTDLAKLEEFVDDLTDKPITISSPDRIDAAELNSKYFIHYVNIKSANEVTVGFSEDRSLNIFITSKFICNSEQIDLGKMDIISSILLIGQELWLDENSMIARIKKRFEDPTGTEAL